MSKLIKLAEKNFQNQRQLFNSHIKLLVDNDTLQNYVCATLSKMNFLSKDSSSRDRSEIFQDPVLKANFFKQDHRTSLTSPGRTAQQASTPRQNDSAQQKKPTKKNLDEISVTQPSE